MPTTTTELTRSPQAEVFSVPLLHSMGDHGRQTKKSDKISDSTTIEEQLILRVPPHLAEIVRSGCRGKSDLELNFTMGM